METNGCRSSRVSTFWSAMSFKLLLISHWHRYSFFPVAFFHHPASIVADSSSAPEPVHRPTKLTVGNWKRIRWTQKKYIYMFDKTKMIVIKAKKNNPRFLNEKGKKRGKKQCGVNEGKWCCHGPCYHHKSWKYFCLKAANVDFIALNQIEIGWCRCLMLITNSNGAPSSNFVFHGNGCQVARRAA